MTPASESQHWYYCDGSPCYELPKAKGDGKKSPTLADARKLGLVPGYTTIANVAAKPGLENWRLNNMLMSALTLPRINGETLDAYARRAIVDAQIQSKAAAERGTSLHAAIEQSLNGQTTEWDTHVKAIRGALTLTGIKWSGTSEKTFCHALGYGGKCDMSWDNGLLDFKTKDRIEPGKRLAFDNHIMQLAAYAMGVFGTLRVRALNVFVGVEDVRVQISEYTYDDLVRGWKQFRCLLDYWYLTTGLERQLLIERLNAERHLEDMREPHRQAKLTKD